MTEYQDDYLNPSTSLAVFSWRCCCILLLFSSSTPRYLGLISRTFDRSIELWAVDRPFTALLISAAGALLELLHCASTTRPVRDDGVGQKCTAPLGWLTWVSGLYPRTASLAALETPLPSVFQISSPLFAAETDGNTDLQYYVYTC